MLVDEDGGVLHPAGLGAAHRGGPRVERDAVVADGLNVRALDPRTDRMAAQVDAVGIAHHPLPLLEEGVDVQDVDQRTVRRADHHVAPATDLEPVQGDGMAVIEARQHRGAGPEVIDEAVADLPFGNGSPIQHHLPGAVRILAVAVRDHPVETNAVRLLPSVDDGIQQQEDVVGVIVRCGEIGIAGLDGEGDL